MQLHIELIYHGVLIASTHATLITPKTRIPRLEIHLSEESHCQIDRVLENPIQKPHHPLRT